MVKTIKEMTIIVRDTEEPGEPDEAEVYYKIVNGGDNSLSKEDTYIIEEPDFTKTTNQFWLDEKAHIKDIEGIE